VALTIEAAYNAPDFKPQEHLVVFLNAEPEKLERASNGLENRQRPAAKRHKIGVGKTADTFAGALAIGERYPLESGR
jgi:hypothetical protein